MVISTGILRVRAMVAVIERVLDVGGAPKIAGDTPVRFIDFQNRVRPHEPECSPMGRPFPSRASTKINRLPAGFSGSSTDNMFPLTQPTFSSAPPKFVTNDAAGGIGT